MKSLEEKLRVLQISKDELQSHHNQQQTMISELTSKNSSLTLEVESYKRRIEELSEVQLIFFKNVNYKLNVCADNFL